MIISLHMIICTNLVDLPQEYGQFCSYVPYNCLKHTCSKNKQTNIKLLLMYMYIYRGV